MAKLEKLSKFDTLFLKLVKANSYRLKGLLCGQITQTQFFILKLVAEHEHCKAADIALILDISPSAATTIIERLFKNGWIKRERSNQDRRIVWLKLTQQGEKLLSDIEVKRLQLLMLQFEHITEEEVVMACQLMEKALAGADN